MKNNNASNGFMLKNDKIVFEGDLVGLEQPVSNWYAQLEIRVRNAAPFTRDGFIKYVKSLVYYRVEQINDEDVKLFILKEVFVPAFCEHILKYICKGYDVNSGFHFTWRKFDFEPFSIEEMVNFSMKLATVASASNDLVKGFPRVSDTGSDCLYEVYENSVIALSSVNLQSVGLSAILNQQLSSESQQFRPCFRKIITNANYARMEVQNGWQIG